VASKRDVQGFDLLLNPFAILSVTPSASKEEIAEAFNERLADGSIDESLLREARRVLLVPNQRLTAELSYLIDTPQKTILQTLRRVEDAIDISAQKDIARSLPPLSRLNLLAHAASSSCDSELLVSIVDARSEIDPKALTKKLSQTRSAAGLSRLTAEIVEAGLQTHFAKLGVSVLLSYSDVDRAATDMKRCVDHSLITSATENQETLGLLLKAYGSRVSSDRSRYAADAESALEDISEDPTDGSALQNLSHSLEKWERLSHPIQAYEKHLDRDDQESRVMYRKTRELALDLANTHERYDASLAIFRLCKRIFVDQPGAVEQVDDDIRELDEILVMSSAKPLMLIVNRLSDDPKGLVRDLRVSKFGSSSKGIAADLYNTFQQTVQKLSDTVHFDLPWMMLRDLSIKLNNDHHDPTSGVTILEFVTAHPLFDKVSSDHRSQLKADEKTCRQNAYEQKLAIAFQNKDTPAVAEAAQQLAFITDDPEKKSQYTKLSGALQKKVKKSIWPFVVTAIFVLMVAVGVMDKKPNRTYSPPVPTIPKPSTRQTPPPMITPTPEIHADTGMELRPTSSVNQEFTIENLRYCMRESKRLEIIKPLVSFDDNKVIDLFNADINDFNARCANYRYFERDRITINRETNTLEKRIEQEAFERLKRWRSASAAVVPSVNAPPSQDVEPSFQQTHQKTTLDILVLEDAALVQSVLADLGYFAGPNNGTWGPKSRRALYLFKRANGLANDDGFDSVTESKLFGNSAISYTSDGFAEDATPAYTYAPPQGAKLNPLNAKDAALINSRLRDLGFYKGKQLEIWSGLSRDAVDAFMQSRGLPANARWSGEIEHYLFTER
jgi:hypothetical protein